MIRLYTYEKKTMWYQPYFKGIWVDTPDEADLVFSHSGDMIVISENIKDMHKQCRDNLCYYFFDSRVACVSSKTLILKIKVCLPELDRYISYKEINNLFQNINSVNLRFTDNIGGEELY